MDGSFVQKNKLETGVSSLFFWTDEPLLDCQAPEIR